MINGYAAIKNWAWFSSADSNTKRDPNNPLKTIRSELSKVFFFIKIIDKN